MSDGKKFYPASALELAFRRLDTAEAKGDEKEIAKARQRIRNLDPHGTGHPSMMPLTAYEIAAKETHERAALSSNGNPKGSADGERWTVTVKKETS